MVKSVTLLLMFEVILIAVLVYFCLLVKSLALQYFLLFLIFLFSGHSIYTMWSGAPFVATTKDRLKTILKLGDFVDDDVVVDLGGGDGRVIRAIWGKGVKRALAYEISLPTYLYGRLRTFCSGTGEQIVFGNLWKQDYSKATKIVCFLMDKAMARFEKEIWPQLKEGTVVIVNQFPMPNVVEEREEKGIYLYRKV